MLQRLQSLQAHILRRSLVSWILWGAFVLVGVVAVHEHWFLNDEGLLTWTFASMASAEPAATLFLLKSRPLVSAVYLAPAAAGILPFLVVHVLLGSVAILLVGRAARNERQQWPNVAPVIVATSPLFLAAAPSGISNGDGVALVAAALALLSTKRFPLLTGVVFGALPLVRSELVVIGLPLALYALRLPKPGRFVLGALLVPVPYFLAGAFYHQDLAWPLHFPPTLAASSPDNPYFAGGREVGVGDTLDALLAVSPALPLVVLARWSALTPLERASLWAAGFFLVAIRLLPVFGIFNFDESPRYLLPLLPLAALLGGRVVSVWGSKGDDSAWAPLGLLLVTVATLALDERVAAGLGLAVGLALLLSAVRVGWRWSAPLGLLLVLTVGGILWMPAGRMRLVDQRAEVHRIASWLNGEGDGRPVVTNNRLLAPWLTMTGHSVRIRYIVQPDQMAEMRGISNPRNGQREVLLREMARLPYGDPLFMDGADTPGLRGDEIFVLMDDSRLAGAMDPDYWEPRLRLLEEGPNYRILERLNDRP